MRRPRTSTLFRATLAAALAAVTIPFAAHAAFGDSTAVLSPTAQAFPTRTGIGVAWDTTDAATYRVERKTATDWQDASGPLTGTTWVDETVAAGSSADYRVVATTDAESATSPEIHATRPTDIASPGDLDVLALDANRGGSISWLQNETAGPISASAAAGGSRTLAAGSLKLRIPAYFAGPGYYTLNSQSAVTVTQGTKSCDSAATVHVLAVSYTPDGQLETLAASLAAGTCAGAEAVASFEIRYKTSLGYQMLSVTPDALEAGRVMAGTSKDLTLTLKNTGTEPLQFGNMSLNSTAPWTFTRNCDPELAGGASCTVTLTFAPTEGRGEYGVRFTIPDSTALSSHQVLATGTATSLPPAGNVSSFLRTYQGATLTWPAWNTAGGTTVRGYFIHTYLNGSETTKYVTADPNRATMAQDLPVPAAGTEYALSVVNEIGEGPVGARRAATRPTAEVVVTDTLSSNLQATSLDGYIQPQDHSVIPKGAVATAPDGRTLAFMSTGADTSLWTQRVEPGRVDEPVKIWTAQAKVTHLAWSPDGTRIAFQAPENGTPCVYVIATTGGNPEKVACDLTSPSWMPDARTLVVVDRRFDGDDRFARVQAAAGGARVATLPAPTAAADGAPVRVSPDGRRVAFGAGNTVKFVDFSSDKVTTSLPLDAPVRALTWDPDNGGYLYAAAPGVVRVDTEHLTYKPAPLPTVNVLRGDYDLAWQRLGLTIAPTPASVGTSASVAFDGSALLPGTTYTCSSTYAPAAACTSPYQVSGLATGENLVTITATEPDGRVTKAYRTLVADASGPVARVTGPNYQSSVAASAIISVTATDPAGVAAYDVRYRRASFAGPYSAYVQPWTGTTATSMTLAIAAGYEYCVSVRAKDKLGNVGGWSVERCFSRPLDDRSMTMATAGWARGSSTKFYYGTDTQATASGMALTRTVQGKRFFLIATRCPTCGAVGVYAGNRLLATVNLAYPTTHYQVVLGLPVQSTLFSGTLTLRTVSTGKLVQIDGLSVGRT